MFDTVLNHQPLADAFKCMVLASRHPKKHAALGAVKRFETMGWHPAPLTQAIEEIAPDGFMMENGLLVWAHDSDPLATVEAVLLRYCALVAPEVDDVQTFSTKEAADYLGVSVNGMKHLIHDSGQIAGVKKGGSLTFSKRVLDAYKRRKLGRGQRMVKAE